MPELLTEYTDGQTLPASSLNFDNDLIEASFLDLGPYVITGLDHSAGTGLSVNVTAGTASIGGRVTVGSGFTISGLSPSTTNHLYVLQNGTGTSNTSGTQPAASVKLGTAVTDGSGVTSVTETGRQEKVDITNVARTNAANTWSADQTLDNGTDLILGTGSGSMVGTSASQKLAFFGATPIVQPANTVNLIDIFNNLGLRATGGNPGLNIGSGAIIAGTLALSGIISGSGLAAFSIKRFALTFSSDADYTLTSGEADAILIDVQAGAFPATTRNIIVPATTSSFYIVINRNAQAVVLKTASGTGLTVATNRSRIIVFPTGANAFSLTPDNNYAV